MKVAFLVGLLSLGLLLASGCATTDPYEGMTVVESVASSDEPNEINSLRKFVWQATLKSRVGDLSNVVEQATSFVKVQDGFIETRSDYKDTSVDMKLRVPANAFETTVAELGRIGSVSYQCIDGKDVTESYTDLEARLKNKRLLRDRLQVLLEKATTVADTIALEHELSRAQSDLDAMEARMLQLRSCINYATIHLTFERKKILGPITYVLGGVFWTLGKLFVIY